MCEVFSDTELKILIVPRIMYKIIRIHPSLLCAASRIHTVIKVCGIFGNSFAKFVQ